MIRTATLEDFEIIVTMLDHYKVHSPLALHKNSNLDTARVMVKFILEQNRGIILLAEKDDKVIGMLIAIKNFNVWNQEAFCMNELAYWVEPEHRGGTAGYRLIKSYADICIHMKEQGEIEYFTISKMVTSPDLSYDKFGFTKLEETWSHQ
jgi:N-acetylglutamate synthase-like GNAT family acetyltransferase